jgi:dehydrodolichyl diphosphate syntase complex subunit NUS1
VRSLKRLPQHLSVILTLRKEDDALAVLMDEVAELTAWCTCAGIAQLSVYEKSGTSKLTQCRVRGGTVTHLCLST